MKKEDWKICHSKKKNATKELMRMHLRRETGAANRGKILRDKRNRRLLRDMITNVIKELNT